LTTAPPGYRRAIASAPPPPDLSFQLASIDELAAARCKLRGLLDHSGDPNFVDAALLAASELLTNSVIHTTNDTCHLAAWYHPEPPALRVEVNDTNPTLPTLQHSASPTEGGRGLRIVQAVTTRWGVNPHPQGKTVWFEIDQPRP
jgi:anti-sigma regulatory factor (Ser/Thr protein kinase)